MASSRRGFALVELFMVAVVACILLLLMLPLTKQRWNADGQSISENNVRQLMVATAQYCAEHAGRVPMRGNRYSLGQIQNGWDTWHVAGKNCNTYWSSTAFDEHAKFRFLNPYIQTQVPPTPSGAVNTGSGSTWTFSQGILTAQQRPAFALKLCRSPGDTATYQHTWPLPTSGLSSYDDVGTSYHVNMKWWDIPGGPAPFTTRFNTATQIISNLTNALGKRPVSNFVFMHDQVADVVANSSLQIMGEFGGINMSVLGFMDGRAAYTQVVNSAMSGPGYTFGISW